MHQIRRIITVAQLHVCRRVLLDVRGIVRVFEVFIQLQKNGAIQLKHMEISLRAVHSYTRLRRAFYASLDPPITSQIWHTDDF